MESLASRIRWGNVARAAGVLGLIGLVLAWPRLAPRNAGLPAVSVPATARTERPVTPSRPVAEPAPTPVTRRGEKRAHAATKRRTPRRKRPPVAQKRRRVVRKRGGVRRTSSAVAVAAAAPARSRWTAPPPPAPPGPSEFVFG